MKIPRFIVSALILLLAAAGAARAETISMTVETGGYALLVTGDEAVISEIDAALEKIKPGNENAAALASSLLEKYPGKVEIEMFAVPGSAAADAVITRLTVREAVLRGVTPPVEGLSFEEASAVLAAFGFTVFSGKDFDRMSEAGRRREFYLAEGTALMLDGAGPYDYITIYRKKGGGGEPPAEN